MLDTFKNVQCTTKLFFAVVLITITSVFITSGTAIRMAKNMLLVLGEGEVRDIHEAVYNSLLMYDKNIRIKLDGDLLLFKKELSSRGGFFLDEGKTIEQTLVHQMTKQSITQEIPQMQVGVSYLNNYFDIVDDIVTTIVTAVEEQSITTDEIVNNVTQASQGIIDINENVASSNHMTSSMSDGMAQVKENSQQISSAAEELSQLSGRLTDLVSRFTI